MKLTDLLDEIARLDQQATTGPWEYDGSTIDSKATFDEVVTTEVNCSMYCYGGTGKGVQDDNDAEFIALARTALPQLARALEAVLDMLDTYQAPTKRVEPTDYTSARLGLLERRIREAITDAMEDDE